MNVTREWPHVFSQHERAMVLALLERGRLATQPYKGDWKASWLLTDVRAPIWLLRGRETRWVKNQWVGAYKFDWAIPLYDGTTLTHPSNERMLDTMQRAAFLVRHLPHSAATTRGHLSWINACSVIAQWLYFHADRFAPRTDLFRRVDGDAVAEFMHIYVDGGRGALLQVPQRCLSFFYRHALGAEPLPDVLRNVFDVPKNDREKIVEWLRQSGYYERTRRSSSEFISRPKLDEMLNSGGGVFVSHKLTAFLRQFEPTVLDRSSDLLVPVERERTEHWMHTTLLLKEAVERPISMTAAKHYLLAWKDLLRLRRHLPHAFPDTSQIKLARAQLVIDTESGPDEHTPWVPLKTSLAYTTEALRWVARWGDPLVDFYTSAVVHFKREGLFNEEDDLARHRFQKRLVRNRWINEHLPKELGELNISGWTTIFTNAEGADHFDRLRRRPSINDALQILIGAVILLLGITKPIRESEIRQLRIDSIKRTNDGYWLEQHIRKRNIGDHLLESSRPIPSIVARGLAMAKRLSKQLVALAGETNPYAKTALFYLPRFHRTGSLAPRVILPGTITQCLDRFCDYVDLKPDKFGRRWYVRPHELRKSFLITFFWCFKFSGLEAARWVAGHKDIGTIYAYITANFPGLELPRLEAEYTHQQVMGLFKAKNPGETENLEVLYRAVCNHFGVSEINAVPEKELLDWLEIAFAKGIYRIHPYQMESRDGLIKTAIAYDIRKEAGNVEERRASPIGRNKTGSKSSGRKRAFQTNGASAQKRK